LYINEKLVSYKPLSNGVLPSQDLDHDRKSPEGPRTWS